ncbi:MAG: flippase-like domain-containing protein [Candidatus Aenigmarchaeota archaeon]|nr:flippase-like domain-containing protein [Candidatus Aenigmarchaeota archaeon]
MPKRAPLFIAVAFIIVAVLLSEPEKIVSSFLHFRRDLIIPVILLSIANYITRFVRWEFLLSGAGIKIQTSKSLLIFFSSFLFSIAPAKSGDLVKVYYLKKHHQIKYSLSLPVVVLERVYDVIGIVLLIFVSAALYFPQQRLVFIVATSLVFMLSLFIKPTADFFLRRINPPFFRKKIAQMKRAFASSEQIFSRKLSFISLSLGAVAWFFECIGLYFIVLGFGLSPDIIRETFVYSASTLGGAISMLPGGLGATEGGMAYLLSSTAGIVFSTALSITLVIRAFTLWFAVVLGFFANIMLARTEPQKK